MEKTMRRATIMENRKKGIFVREDGTVVTEDQYTEEDLREIEELRKLQSLYDWEKEKETEVDVARSEGFWLDDDCNWIPMDDDDWY